MIPSRAIEIDAPEGEIGFLEIVRPRAARIAKRALDVALSLTLMVLLAPLGLLFAVLIKLTSAGPILYWDTRVGQFGKTFRMPKFRTMFANAHRFKHLLLHKNEISGPLFKIKQDPRVTLVGRFLRKHSFDELPQLWSVLKGEMSLIGPRPPLPEEYANYQPWHKKRLLVKPGATGLWQVTARNEIDDFDECVRIDLEYIQNWSLKLDLKILLGTIRAVLRGTGY